MGCQSWSKWPIYYYYYYYGGLIHVVKDKA
jgi:hypothetical protein